MKIHIGKRLLFIMLTILLAFVLGYLYYTGVALE
jgi:hypothetical protein